VIADVTVHYKRGDHNVRDICLGAYNLQEFMATSFDKESRMRVEEVADKMEELVQSLGERSVTDMLHTQHI
jgi:hypothetical protein